ncbi:uncharacterized protein LOC111085966 [Limulus polyphemus]|uniref:Uncharacterized protein LOC111085966 n=1 Tax=Limulus polyphemus TaxID=6850 RepID=A0ABM1SGE7_LIMPO|nr:uncharacterized protein LOC111085966 [Limulus polyphemus]
MTDATLYVANSISWQEVHMSVSSNNSGLVEVVSYIKTAWSEVFPHSNNILLSSNADCVLAFHILKWRLPKLSEELLSRNEKKDHKKEKKREDTQLLFILVFKLNNIENHIIQKTMRCKKRL